MKYETKEMSLDQREELISTLKARFDGNMNHHKNIEWVNIESKLEANVEKLGH